VLAFLWNFWLEDIFTDSERITIPNFVGENSEEVIESKAFEDIFNFHVVYSLDPNAPEGEIISQKPEAGRSIMISDEGIDIELTVSTGILKTKMPDLVNHEYREAKLILEKLSFAVEVETVPSDTITEGYVVSTDPAANEEVASGSTVHIYVSGGPELKEVTMPNLVGKSKDAAVAALSKLSLKVGSISEEESGYAAGTVIWQNVSAGEKIMEGSVVYLKVSTGPAASPSPEPPAESAVPSAEPSSGASA
ncbi:MAG: PASTA domain-containing protein, partial [Clostridiales bacterium]|nr:PASTA domain-containing protein [Clostridiales bacterium]